MKVIHFKKFFLYNTETFIFNQIVNTPDVEAHVLCRKRLNAINFNYEEIKEIHEIPVHVSWGVQKQLFAVCGVLGLRYRLDLKGLEERVRQIGGEILHAHFGPDGNLILPVALKLDIPLVTSFYGYDVSQFPKSHFGLAKRAYRQLIQHGDVFLAMSQNMKQELMELGFSEEKIRIHHFGIDYDYFSRKKRIYGVDDDGKISLIQIASFLPKKGQIYLLKALDRIVNNLKRDFIRVRLIGTGPREKELKQFVKERKLENYVDFLGFVPISDEYVDWLYKSHIYVHPSVTDKSGGREGIPTALLEAMASGMPAISSYHAGIPDVIQNEENGFLNEERDVDALVESIIRLAENIDLRRESGEKAQKTIYDKFNIKIQGQKLRDIYLSLVA
ncbi:hypothetical protein B6D60_08690 [candidate division KSB1 bacterium 4484_87]|nr:MAG: hypothetical protein B6D60_08690 [candidate division KSB1 bacterium 4484_87]